MRVGERIEVPPESREAGEARTAFEAFARREQQPLVAFAWSLTGSFTAAEEIVQEALTVAWRSWDRVSGYDKPGAWARRVVVSRCTDRRRRAGREQRALLRLFHRRPDDSIELPPADDELWIAVRALPDRQAQAVALHYLEDLPVAEIAEILKCTEGTVKTHLHRGRTALARALGLRDVDDPAEDGRDEDG